MTPKIALRNEPGVDFQTTVKTRIAELCAPCGTIARIDVYFDEIRFPRSGVVIVDFATLEQLNTALATLGATLFADGAAFYFIETDPGVEGPQE